MYTCLWRKIKVLKTINVHIEDLKIDWYIGIFDFEYEKAQKVVIDIFLNVLAPKFSEKDDYDDVVCYKSIIDSITELSKNGHVRLVETLGDKIADLCLKDQRVLSAKVKVTKPDAFDFVSSVGITVLKKNKKET